MAAALACLLCLASENGYTAGGFNGMFYNSRPCLFLLPITPVAIDAQFSLMCPLPIRPLFITTEYCFGDFSRLDDCCQCITAGDSPHVQYTQLPMWEEFFPSQCLRKSSTILCTHQETTGGSPGKIEGNFRAKETEDHSQRFRFNVNY